MKKLLILGLFFSLLTLTACSLKRAERQASDGSRQTGRGPDLPQEANTAPRLVVREGFTLEAPANWKESPALMPGISLMMVNSTETSERPEVKKINFKSYFSVSYDTLGEKTLEKYTADLKDKLTRLVVGISFQDLEPTLVDGRPTQVFSADLTQQGVDFKLLMFAAEGKDKDVWMISFNTLATGLSGYQDLFSKVAASFRVK
ncbi:MAG: hypothetical protein Q8N57_00130 [bacterium]|nr:hypothetical protein [bacterium]